MHTDEESVQALITAAGVKDANNPATALERNRVLALATKPEHVGCRHLRGMLTSPGEYNVRKELVEWSMQTYLNIYFDKSNPLRTRLLYVVSKGPAVKSPGSARIWSPDECPGIAPLIVTNTGDSTLAVNHEAHVSFFRQDLARFLAWQNAAVDVKTLFAELQNLGKMLSTNKMSAYTESKPNADVIFTSAWDKWPF